jgi:FixJ family two-component response regulator
MNKATSDRNAEAPALAPIKVAIIDDEQSMRKALARLMKSAGIEAAVFSSALEFLDDAINLQVDCAMTDLRMPGLDGLSFQEEIGKTLPHLSLIFITGHGNVPASVKAMKSGAVDFLEKPVESTALLTAVQRAAERSRALKASHDELVSAERRYQQLTPRERQVFALIVAGLLNKQAASDLGIAEKTVKVHRARVMEKMAADSLAELVRMAERLGVGRRDARQA